MARIEIDGIEYITAAEVCDLLGVKPATLYAYVSRGRLRSFKRGGRTRLYPASDVEKLLTLEATHPARIPAAEDWMPYTG